MTLDLPSQSGDLASTQENEHAQCVHDTATSSLVYFEGFVAATQTYLTPANLRTALAGGIQQITPDIPYNTVSIHIPIMDILSMGGSAVFVVAILSQPMARTWCDPTI